MPTTEETARNSNAQRTTEIARNSATHCENAIDAAHLRSLVESDAIAVGVDPKLALTILDLESDDGVHLNSDKGARGPMQLSPATAARYGVKDVCDPVENVHGAMLFLKDLTAQFQGNMMLIAAAYNAGPERVYDARGVPPITETVRYVANAANRYYDLNVFAYRKKRASSRLRLPEPRPEVASNDTLQRDRSGQQWIGGSVLYVGGSENGEAQ